MLEQCMRSQCFPKEQQSSGMSNKCLRAYIIATPSAEKKQILCCHHYSHENAVKARVQRFAIPSSHICIF